jgi:diphthamide synthase (EF-2-diphthine--ammonia ligase)
VASPVVLSFSGGKDSVLALERLRADGWDVRALLAAVVEDDGTLAMHGVPERLVALQAASLGVPLAPLRVPREAANPVYEARLAAALEPFRAQGVGHVAFGDLFLADIKAYRDALMARLGFEPVYPLWRADTAALAQRLVDEGYRGVAVCIDTAKLGAEWAGRELGADFFAGHTFVYDGPAFAYPVRFERSTGAGRGAFAYATLRPLAGEACARCGATFECGMKAGVERCWCADLPAIAPSTAYETCLCPRCLRGEIASRATSAH